MIMKRQLLTIRPYAGTLAVCRCWPNQSTAKQQVDRFGQQAYQQLLHTSTDLRLSGGESNNKKWNNKKIAYTPAPISANWWAQITIETNDLSFYVEI